ncbi:MAG: hypothetical protein ACXVB0_06810 [Mucilaginibacter sp.]
MHILVNHKISDPQAYWSILQANPAMPEGYKVLTMMAGADPSSAACLWAAPDVDSLKTLVDGTLGHTSTNTYMAINDQNSFGL